MKVQYTYQIPVEGDKLDYTFKEGVVTVYLKRDGEEYTETFDFSSFPDGHLELYDEEGKETVKHSLPIPVLLGAKRVEGVLHVELLKWIDSFDGIDSRISEWLDVTEGLEEETNGKDDMD